MYRVDHINGVRSCFWTQSQHEVCLYPRWLGSLHVVSPLTASQHDIGHAALGASDLSSSFSVHTFASEDAWMVMPCFGLQRRSEYEVRSQPTALPDMNQ
jgi:hypothetical protein